MKCVCNKVITLKHKYDLKYFLIHSNGKGCNIKENDQPILNFFGNIKSKNDKSKTRQPFVCIGLRENIHKTYIERIGGFIEYGGAPRIEVVAKKLFPNIFTINNKFSRKRLSNDQLNKLDSILKANAKWKVEIESDTQCIRSINCERSTINSSNLCDNCNSLKRNKVFKVK